MNGRDESNKKVEGYIRLALQGQPRYLRGFDSSLNILPKSRYGYIRDVINFLDYVRDELNIDVDDASNFNLLRPSDLASYIKNLDSGQSAKLRTHFALKKFFGFLKMDGYIKENMMKEVDSPKAPEVHEAISLTSAEIQIMLHNIQHPEDLHDNGHVELRKEYMNRNLSMVKLALTNGIRVSSILEINLSDVDLNADYILVIQKGDRTHKVWLTESVKKDLEAWIEDRKRILARVGSKTDALFISPMGKRMNAVSVNQMLEWASTGINKHITAHKLRSTCATTIYEKTRDIYLAKEMLGHTSIQTTMRYIKADERPIRDAAKMMADLC